MDNNFKCRSCGVEFMADDSMEVKCPACNSDNIDIYKESKGSKKTIIFALIAFIVCIGAGIGIKFLINGDEKGYYDEYSELSEQVVPSDFAESQTVNTIPDPEPIKELILEYNNDLVPDNRTRTYSFSYGCKNLPNGAKIEYRLYDFATGKEVMSSRNGSFSGVPAATDETGSYEVRMEAEVDGKTVTASNIVTGCFKFPEATMAKLTVGELQSLVNQMIKSERSSVISSNPQICQNVSLHFSDLRGDSAPTGISGLLSRITMGIWSGLTVTGVNYEEGTNRVNSITFRPIWAED